MIELDRLKVSLTKNGYLKIADLLKQYPSWELLEHVEGSHPGINIKRSQVANILGADTANNQVPPFWEDIKGFGPYAIDAFTLVAIIMSHHRLIEVLRRTNQSGMSGHIRRDDLPEKEYTNLVYAMATIDLCDYVKGAEGVSYDFYNLVYALKDAGALTRALIESKLRKCGWVDPAIFPWSTDRDFFSECDSMGLHEVFGLEPEQFQAWLECELDMDEPDNTHTLPNRPR